MSQYNSPDTADEFIKRTKKIVEQYNKQECYYGSDFYNVTLLVNCLLGLIVVPRENKLNSLTDTAIPKNLLATIKAAVDQSGNNITIKFKEYIIGLRNGVVHFSSNDSLSFNNNSGKIESLEIIGKTNKKKNTITYFFKLNDSNQLEIAVNEILNYVYGT